MGAIRLDNCSHCVRDCMVRKTVWEREEMITDKRLQELIDACWHGGDDHKVNDVVDEIGLALKEYRVLREQNKRLIEDACNLVDCAENCADWFDALDKHNDLMETIAGK